MANTKSAIKASRQAERRTVRNRALKTRLRTLRKKFTATAAGEDKDAAKVAAAAYVSAMDKAIKSGAVHKNAASRAKAKVSKVVFAK